MRARARIAEIEAAEANAPKRAKLKVQPKRVKIRKPFVSTANVDDSGAHAGNPASPI